MSPRRLMQLALVPLLVLLSAANGFAQSAFSDPRSVKPSMSSSMEALASVNEAPFDAVTVLNPTSSKQFRPFSRVGFGVKAGMLGIGFEAASPIARYLNVRSGADFFNYNRSFSIDNINYDAKFDLRSVEASVDFFPWARGLHISPGALVYNGTKLSANANVPSGSSFTLNGNSYISSTTSPVTGTANVNVNHFSPKLTLGFGNLIPRNGRHFSVPFEIGFAYFGDPKVNLNFTGVACSSSYPLSNCQDVTASQQIQSDIAAQEAKFQKDASAVRLMPLFSIGIAFNRSIGRK